MATRPDLKLHNTLSGTLEVFQPLDVGTVRMYNCGPTVYDRQHIGNLFAAVFADTLRRTLTEFGYEVKQVINITDFGHLSGDNEGNADIGEDRMSKGLKREGLALTLSNMRTMAEKYAQLYFDDIKALGVELNRITFPRASDYITEQIALIQALEEKGYAYRISDGIYFDTSKFAHYGKLGQINLDGLQAGARVGHNTEKHNPHDFVLWKSDKKIGWESPWGLGFPGWHIECTAMIFALLGKQIDIHTGGIEHIPIHHNNEIAQAEAASGKQFSRFWLHNAHITLEGKKISKSLGNTVYVHNLVDRGLEARAFRYWALTGHYRTPANFTWDALEGANTALLRLSRMFLETAIAYEKNRTEPEPSFARNFYTAMANDLDTPKALALVWDMVKNAKLSPTKKHANLLLADHVLGLGFTEGKPMVKLGFIATETLPQEVQEILQERETARVDKDFTRGDELREKLSALGYNIKDTSLGPQLTKK